MKVCRLCLHNGTTEFISVLNNEDLIQKIKECVAVEIMEDDDMPTTACFECIQKIESWANFKETCSRSNKILLEHSVQVTQQSKLDDRSLKDLKYVINEQNVTFEKQDEQMETLVGNLYGCDICLMNFNGCLEYLDHQSVHNGEPVFKCDKCSEVYKFRHELVEHDRQHKRPCPHCGKLILRSSMKLHLIKHTDRHMCGQCFGRFNSRAALHQHIITIHTDRKDHICETCGKRFSSKTAMTVHLRSHSDERLYKCKHCDYAGRTASAVYVHMATHSKEVCVCEICSKIFKSNRNLNDHLRRVHSKEKKHECLYCNKRFVDKYMLTVHIRGHTGVRPYPCQLCDKAFIRSDGLKEHMAIHGERVWYGCDKCGKKFASKKGVTRHHCSSVSTLHQ